MLQHITLDEVKAACRNLYRENRLLAQHPKHPGYAYQLMDNGIDYRCAIGTVLSPETLTIIKKRDAHLLTLSEFNDEGTSRSPFVTYPDEDHDALCEIQSAHDRWLGRQESAEYFLSLIQE